ncbi:MAG TPA: DUF5979 domain-containing protein [Syntrophomonas sp.]|nr:DUF5979 domain-containing protein [Syntrophomonas sp.]
MKRYIYKKLLSIILTFCLTLAFFTFSPGAGTAYAADVTATLTNITATVTQDGNTIDEGDTITSTKPIRVDISFGVPVEGDDPTPPATVKQGDTAQFQLSDAFTVLTGGSIDLKMGTLLVGHASFTTDPVTNMVTANVVFDGDASVFDGTSHTVTCQFHADFEYDNSGAGGSTGDHTVTILEKTYTVNVPALPIEYKVTKTGVAHLADKSVAWKVYVEATQGGKGIDLGGYKFFDDLASVGDYVYAPGSFRVGSDLKTPVWNPTTKALSYTFPSGSASPQTITFDTTIPDGKYYGTGEQKIANTAQLKDSTDTVKKTGTGEVKFTPQWIIKEGAASGDGSSGVYDPKNRTITWTITANQMGATLNNVFITDVLPKEPKELTLKFASWQAWNGSAWGAATPITPINGEYEIGNINSKILLTIVTNVPDDTYTTGITTYSNSASIRWDGRTGIGTGKIPVGIGYNAIEKSGVADTVYQKVTWTVNVDTKKQPIPDLKVYDLLVYEKSIDLKDTKVTGIPVGINVDDLTPQYGQKYIDSSFNGSGLNVTVYPILEGTTRVADLLEITGFSTSDLNTFSFDTQVLDPNIYAANAKETVTNTASLFSANAKLNAATANVDYTSNLLAKEMLKREAIANPAAGVNTQKTTTPGASFDYQEKSAIFRLSVNADGMDLTDMVVDAAGTKLGKATLTDTLPEGWEFTEIVSGKDYLIFAGNTGTDKSVVASNTTPLDTVTGLSAVFGETVNSEGKTVKTVAFTFDQLDQPYVILVKAKLTDAAAAKYFSGNQTTTVTNQLSLSAEHWTPGISVSRDVLVVSQILDKSYTLPSAGVLTWTVEYKPYDLAQPGEEIRDTLPIGIDLRTDANGTLLLAGNITVNEMTLNANGSYALGSPVTLELGTNVSYDNATRVLSFIIPDSAKAYRFIYITDITGEPGTVTNQVSLLGSSAQQEGTSKNYSISALDGSASLLRNGWISIRKTDGAGVPLTGAEFTLYATDGSTVIKKGVTGSDGIVKLKVIPDGQYLLRETKAPTGYTPDSATHSVVVTTSGTTVTASIDGKTGADANVVTIKNYSQGTAGNLTIIKTVAGVGADTAKAFDFTLTLNGAPGTYDYTGHGVPNGTIKSGDTISLTHDQSITIVGLPQGATYTVTETDYSGDGYTTASTGATGSIAADATQTASFTNARTVGSLTISKTVAGNAGDTAKAFDFTLTLNGAPGTYDYTGHGVPDGTIKSGDTISLAHGQSISIMDLPDGATYTVTEADYSGDNYTTVSTGETGSVAIDAAKIAAFTNTRTVGNLTISKTVAGNAGDSAKTFDFTLTLNGAPGTYDYTGNGVPDGTIQSGDTISLAHGQSITIMDLPDGATYTVTEADYSGDGYTTVSTDETGSIATDVTRIAVFTNTRNSSNHGGSSNKPGKLTISKTVAGADADTAKKFDFKVTLSGASGSYNYTGKGVADGTIKSGDTVFLAHGQSITITGLPKDTKYTVTEADYTEEGYTASSTGATGVIAADTLKTASFTNHWGNTPSEPSTPGNPPDNDGSSTGNNDDPTDNGSNPTDNGDSATDNIDNANIPQGPVNSGENGIPKTGGNQSGSFALFGLLVFSIVLAVLGTVDFALRKKYSGK